MAKGSTALTTISNALAVAADVDVTDVRGKGNFTKEDTILPQVKVCQGLSPEKDDTDGKYIDGLAEGDLFNSLTETIYDTPLEFALLDLRKRAVEFKKDADGKNTKEIVDRNVPWNDPRCEWGPNGEKPVATRFFDFLVYLPGTMEPAILSMAGSKVKVAKKLISLSAVRPGASWAGLYKLAIVKEPAPKGNTKYYNFKILPAGPTPPEVFKAAEATFNRFSGVAITVHDQGTDDGEVEGANDSGIPF